VSFIWRKPVLAYAVSVIIDGFGELNPRPRGLEISIKTVKQAFRWTVNTWQTPLSWDAHATSVGIDGFSEFSELQYEQLCRKYDGFCHWRYPVSILHLLLHHFRPTVSSKYLLPFPGGKKNILDLFCFILYAKWESHKVKFIRGWIRGRPGKTVISWQRVPYSSAFCTCCCTLA